MNTIYKLTQAALIGLFLCATPSNAGAATPQMTELVVKNAVFIGDNDTMNKDELLSLNRPERHSLAAQPLNDGTNRLATGLLADASGLMETAVAPKLNQDVDYATAPSSGSANKPGEGSYIPKPTPTQEAALTSNSSSWEQVVMLATSVPEPSTYLMFASFLIIAALVKRHRSALQKTL